MSARRLSSAALLAGALVAACADSSTPTSPLAPGAVALKKGGDTKPIDGSNFLPKTPPAPDILMRESFGPGSGDARPAGGSGEMRSTQGGGAPLSSFWLEYPGSKNAQWLSPDARNKWNFAGCSADPYELPSPLGLGCSSSYSATLPASFPTALMPITIALPSGGYEYSLEGFPETTPGAYLAIGFTNSSALGDNLTTAGTLWLRVTDPTGWGVPLHYELRTGSLATGTVLAEGDGGSRGWNHMALRVSPTAGTVTLTFADSVVGTFPATIPQPRYLAFEGVGAVDNFVLRK